MKIDMFLMGLLIALIIFITSFSYLKGKDDYKQELRYEEDMANHISQVGKKVIKEVQDAE